LQESVNITLNLQQRFETEMMNAHEMVGLNREIWWNELELDSPITIELVNYFKAQAYVKGRGYYMAYYAIAREDYPSLGIVAGDELIIYISYKSYINALRKLPTAMKVPCTKQKAEGKNLLMRFSRINKDWCKVHYQKVLEPTPEQLKEGDRIYALLDSENVTFRRK